VYNDKVSDANEEASAETDGIIPVGFRGNYRNMVIALCVLPSCCAAPHSCAALGRHRLAAAPGSLCLIPMRNFLALAGRGPHLRCALCRCRWPSRSGPRRRRMPASARARM
jgi:hypothetical protein